MSISLLSKTPQVTVVMPVYNVEAFIDQAVRSVLAQTFADFELLIIDDESPDRSIDLIQPLLQQDGRIKIISQENRGLAGARNTGIREARGQYIAFLDSDDFWHRDKLKLHVNQLEAHPNQGVSFSASMFVNAEGVPINRVQSPRVKSNYTPRDIFCRNPIGNGSAPIIRRNVLEQIAFMGNNKHDVAVSYWQYFDESLTQSEDIDCWTRLALITGTDFVLIDKPLTYYRLNNLGLSANVDAQLQTWLKFTEKLKGIAPDFIDANLSSAAAYQYRYLARRCLTQANARQSLDLMIKAVKQSPSALIREWKRTLTTVAGCLIMLPMPSDYQKALLKRIGMDL